MTTPAPSPAAAPSPEERRRWRCRRHPERPASARCPACGGTYCRECVVEHDGRILCASCLRAAAQADAPAEDQATSLLTWGRRAGRQLVGLVALVATLWCLLYLARELLEPPSETRLYQPP